MKSFHVHSQLQTEAPNLRDSVDIVGYQVPSDVFLVQSLNGDYMYTFWVMYLW